MSKIILLYVRERLDWDFSEYYTPEEMMMIKEDEEIQLVSPRLMATTKLVNEVADERKTYLKCSKHTTG